MLKRTPGIGGKCTGEVKKPRQAPSAWHASHPESILVHSPWGPGCPMDTLWDGSRASLAKHVAGPSWAQWTQRSGPSTSLHEQEGSTGMLGSNMSSGTGMEWGAHRWTDRQIGQQAKSKQRVRHITNLRAQRDWSGELPGAQGGRGEDKSRRYTSGRMVPAPPFLLPAEQHCPLPCQLSWGSCLPLQVDPAAWAGGVGGVGRPGVTLPPMGAAKQQPTPTAQAAASISMFLASFCERDRSEWALPSQP